MGLVDQLDSAMDRANSSFSSIDAERCRWEDLRSQISSDLQLLQNTISVPTLIEQKQLVV